MTRDGNKFIDTVDECLTNGVKNGIFQVSLEDDYLNGRNVTIEGSTVVNFGSCSYLGLEVDDRLKQGAIDAALRYGTQYSSSRLFSACNLYEELEHLFFQIFGNHPAIVAATTTLTHMGTMPIIVNDNDLVILDHQVHGSVRLAVQLVKARGTKVEMIPHNRMDMLEDMIKENPNKYSKIWYMADGLYSMYGDYAPLDQIEFLLEKYGNFHVYIDDAHGMSWAGKHGSGYVLSKMNLHPKMVLSTSLAKGFGTGGGVTVVNDPELKRRILTCGSSYTFSGPIQPPMLGASIASAKIHLTDEIYELQNRLRSKIELAGSLINQFDLPHVLGSDSPIFYIGLGLPRVGYNMVRRLLKEGFYTNIGIFPGVPVKCCGLRLAVTNGQTDNDLKNVLEAFKHHFPLVLEEENQSVDDISKNFGLPFPKTKTRYGLPMASEHGEDFLVQHVHSIFEVDKNVWNECLGDRGTFDWNGCRFIEETFKGNPEPENNWDVHYLIIRDQNQEVVLATFFSVLLCKDDMISPASVSMQIEMKRAEDKYYRTSKMVMLGSLISLGEHAYVNKKHPWWKKAVLRMISIMNEVKLAENADAVLLRDFDTNDFEFRDFLTEEGFIRADMFNDHVVDLSGWKTDDEFLSRLSSKSKVHLRKYILPYQKLFKVEALDEITPKELPHLINLYRQVKNRGFEMNTFELPLKFFKNLSYYSSWEIVRLSLAHQPERGAVAFGICYKSPSENYVPMIVGIDYEINKDYPVYRQILFQVVKRASMLNLKKLYFGFGADIEKHKFGSKIAPKSVYIQSDDNFKMESLGILQQTNFDK